MHPEQFDAWKNAALNEVFLAIAASAPLREILIFKGARVLNQRLNFERMSLDLDTNLSADFALEMPALKEQSEFLHREIGLALESHFQSQYVVRYTVDSIRVTPKAHPLGWDAHEVKIKLRDAKYANVLNLPALSIDVSAPEKLSEYAIADLPVADHHVHAYTLERIAGEKLRAFLSTLPTYRSKVKKPGEAVRVKDLYDLARIHDVFPASNTAFWDKAGKDFKLACESRYVDCTGLNTFQENWTFTEQTYKADRTLPVDVSFEKAASALENIVGYFVREGIIPFTFSLPDKM